MTIGSEDVNEVELLEGQIVQWRSYVQRRRELSESDVDELEDHLRNTVAELTTVGLRQDEAFLIAFKRMGSLDDMSREFAHDNSSRLWKQLVLDNQPEATKAASDRRSWLGMVICAVLAALAIKIPSLSGVDFDSAGEFYARNISVFAFAPLAAFLAWHRRVGWRTIVALVLFFGVGILAANIYPSSENAHTTILAAIHLPIALWSVVGLAYVAGEWQSHQKRMDFIRFTGESFIYFVLIALGGGALTGITVATFNAIGMDAEYFVSRWMVPCGAMAAVVVSGWLVEAKQNVIENMAPVLTRLFTPLFTVVLIAFLAAMLLSAKGISDDRDVLILFNVVLVVVLGLLLYSISARDASAKARWFDWMQLALVVTALVIDAIVMAALYGRASDAFGFTPNRVATLGVNVILLANLAWSTVLLGGFLFRRFSLNRLERWQTNYLPVYAIWAWAVVIAFPPLFSFA